MQDEESAKSMGRSSTISICPMIICKKILLTKICGRESPIESYGIRNFLIC